MSVNAVEALNEAILITQAAALSLIAEIMMTCQEALFAGGHHAVLDLSSGLPAR